MATYSYQSSNSSISFEFELDCRRKEALISNINIEYDQPVDLALSIKNACNHLSEKYNIEKIIQQVTKEDIALIRGISYFDIVNYSEIYGFYNVSCDIKNFPTAFMTGLGFE